MADSFIHTPKFGKDIVFIISRSMASPQVIRSHIGEVLTEHDSVSPMVILVISCVCERDRQTQSQ